MNAEEQVTNEPDFRREISCEQRLHRAVNVRVCEPERSETAALERTSPLSTARAVLLLPDHSPYRFADGCELAALAGPRDGF